MKNTRLQHPISKALGLSCKYSDPRKDGSFMMTYYQPYDRTITKAGVEAMLYRADIPVQKISVYRWYIKVRTLPGGVA